MFQELIFLVYYNLKRRLYIDIDTSKKGFRVIIYYIKEDKFVFEKENVKLIIFLNKILISAKIRY